MAALLVYSIQKGHVKVVGPYLPLQTCFDEFLDWLKTQLRMKTCEDRNSLTTNSQLDPESEGNGEWRLGHRGCWTEDQTGAPALTAKASQVKQLHMAWLSRFRILLRTRKGSMSNFVEGIRIVIY